MSTGDEIFENGYKKALQEVMDMIGEMRYKLPEEPERCNECKHRAVATDICNRNAVYISLPHNRGTCDHWEGSE